MTGDETPDTPRAAPQPEAHRAEPQIDRRMLESLVCPLTHGTLEYAPEASELISRKAGLAFPIRDGIPIMLESEARVLEG